MNQQRKTGKGKEKERDTLHKTRMKNVKLMEMLFSIIDLKDPLTANHCESVSRYSLIIGKELNLPGDQLDKLNQAALLHDIGKIMVDNCVLNKKKPLTERDFLQIRSHSEKGMRILTQFHMNDFVIDAALHHHERWDGKGYPRGTAGEDIPVSARCLAIADSFDAMTTDRPYRKGMSVEYAAKEIAKGAGTQFDPKLAELFVRLIEEKEIIVLSQMM